MIAMMLVQWDVRVYVYDVTVIFCGISTDIVEICVRTFADICFFLGAVLKYQR